MLQRVGERVPEVGVASRARAEASLSFPPQQVFAGVWVSEAGSRYLSDGDEFVCIAVHHPDFAGWVGKRAIAGITRVGDRWSALQAIRMAQTGRLSEWVPVSLSIDSDLVTKFFSVNIPGQLLVHGHVECYRRVYLQF